MKKSAIALFVATLFGTATGVSANPSGLWATEADRKGQIAHVRAQPCASGYCGTIVEVFGPQGQPINADTIGARVFWNMTPEGNRTYEGRAYVPAHGRTYRAEMALQGNRLEVSGCLGPVCRSQTWTRVQ